MVACVSECYLQFNGMPAKVPINLNLPALQCGNQTVNWPAVISPAAQLLIHSNGNHRQLRENYENFTGNFIEGNSTSLRN